MLNIVALLVNLLNQYILWVYLFCLVLVLWHARSYWQARRDRANTIYTIEREVASGREGRAMTSIGLILGLAVVATAAKYYVLPTLPIEQLVAPTPTVTLSVPTREPTATPTVPPATATPRPRPTLLVLPTTELPTITPAPPASRCNDPNTCISSPADPATVKGRIAIRGTANHGQFQFFKVEYGLGEDPSSWHVIGDVVKAPVLDGLLAEFDTTAVPNGGYTLKLTVVDVTSNFPPPHLVRIVIAN